MSGGILGRACAQCDQRDLIIMMLVERLRHEGTPAHAVAVAAHIKGAPIAGVEEVMKRLVHQVGVLDFVIYADETFGTRPAYAVNALGSEVLNAEVEGWQPSPLEQSRRDSQLASAQAGRLRVD